MFILCDALNLSWYKYIKNLTCMSLILIFCIFLMFPLLQSRFAAEQAAVAQERAALARARSELEAQARGVAADAASLRAAASAAASRQSEQAQQLHAEAEAVRYVYSRDANTRYILDLKLTCDYISIFNMRGVF